MIRRDVNPAAIAKQICDLVGGLALPYRKWAMSPAFA